MEATVGVAAVAVVAAALAEGFDIPTARREHPTTASEHSEARFARSQLAAPTEASRPRAFEHVQLCALTRREGARVPQKVAGLLGASARHQRA